MCHELTKEAQPAVCRGYKHEFIAKADVVEK